MSEKEVILVTGVSGFWGSRVAKELAGRTECRVIGLDVHPPSQEIPNLDFVQADIRNPLLVDLLKTESVETVCHLAFLDTTRPSEKAKDINVMGTMKVLGACAEAGVGKIVIKSSTAIYGAHPRSSAFMTEDTALRGSRRYGYTRDMIEIEAFCNGFQHQVPEMLLTILRFSSIVGPTVDTPMTRFLGNPKTPSLLGFDPMMQIIHEDDVVDALAYAVLNDAPGAFNVAANDVLPLNKIRSLAGKSHLQVFHMFAYRGIKMLGDTGLRLSRYVPIELDYIRYPWVADLTRMREELGFEPLRTAEETLREFAGRQDTGPCATDPADEERGEDRLRDILEQRQRQRERQAASEADTEEEDQHE